MISISLFNLYSVVCLVGLFAYITGIMIRGILAEKDQDNFRARVVEIHSEALKEVNHLKKALRNEMEVRKTAEQLNTRLRAEINVLIAHAPKVLVGGDPSFTEHTGLNGTLNNLSGSNDASGLMAPDNEKAVA